MPTDIAEVVVQGTNDPNTQVYHTRVQLSEEMESGIRGTDHNLGALGCLLLEVPGVVQVQVHCYLILVTKAPLYAFDEIRPKVEQILSTLVISQRQLYDAVENPEPARPEAVHTPEVPRPRTPRPRVPKQA